MTGRAVALLAALAACHASAGPRAPVAPTPEEAGEEQAAPMRDAAPPPQRAEGLAPVPTSALCVTHGALSSGARTTIRDASVRAVAQGTAGDAGELRFTYRGPSAKTSRLASGDVREQLALKLRAADGCNLVYVVWRFAPKAEIVVQTKLNPGAHDNQQCGTNGYAKLRPAQHHAVSAPAPGSDHVLAAAIGGASLTVTVDGAVAWRGELPDAARGLRGPVGVRADNVAADLDLYAAAGDERSTSKCEPGAGAE